MLISGGGGTHPTSCNHPHPCNQFIHVINGHYGFILVNVSDNYVDIGGWGQPPHPPVTTPHPCNHPVTNFIRLTYGYPYSLDLN